MRIQNFLCFKLTRIIFRIAAVTARLISKCITAYQLIQVFLLFMDDSGVSDFADS
jgi:hypothetical protein